MSDATKGYLEFAHFLADLSAREILPQFRARIDVIDKSAGAGFDPVTAADRAGEEVMRAAIAERWPEHGIVGEEFGVARPEAELRWILDPIDGTRGFIVGSPSWGTLIGLARAEAPVLGLMNQPFTGDRFWSEPGRAMLRSHRGEEVIRTRACDALDKAVLVASSPDMFAAGTEQDRFAALSARVRMTRHGTDCIGYCLLAAGHIDLVAEADLKIYDIAALIPIVEAAGGVVTTWDGGNAMTGGRILAAGDRRMHAAAMEVLNG